jgi:uncharacterized protein with beta-barrel porin domain
MMNRAYRVVWNASTGTWQAAPELARAKGKTTGKAALIAFGLWGLLALPMEVHAQVTGLLVGSGGSGGAAVNGIQAGGQGGIGGGGGGYYGGGGGGFGGGGGGSFGDFAGGSGGGATGGSGASINNTNGGGGTGDSNGLIGGNGSMGTGSNAGAAVTSLTSVTTSTASIPFTMSTSATYDYVGVGGGGGGSGSFGAGGTGVDGYLTVTGSGTALAVGTGLLIGGGQGGGAGTHLHTGGSGGSGTLTVEAGASLSAGAAVVQIGGGGGGAAGYVSNAGSGGTGSLIVDAGGSVSAGTLQVGGFGGGGGAGGASGGTGGSGTVTVTGNSTVNVTGSLTLGGAAGGSAGDGTPGGGAGGSGVLSLGGGSTLNFTGTSPSFTINGNGAFNLGSAAANAETGGTLTGLTDLVDNGTINFNQTDTTTVSVNIGGSGSVRQQGSGTTILTGRNTYTGGTTITGGLTNFSNAGSFGTGNIALNGGGVQWATGNTADISGQLAPIGANGGTFDTNGNAVTLANLISGSGGVTVANSGSGGALTLTTNNGYTGGTTINTGASLALSGAGSIASSSGVTDNGTFDISGAANGASIASLSGSGSVNLGNQTLTLTNASGVFGGTISGSGGLTLASGTETLTNISTYTGTTLIDRSATLVLSSSNDIVLGNVVDNGALVVAGTIGNLSGNGTLTVGAQGLALTGSNGAFGGVIAGAGALTLTSGTQTLTSTNTYTGATIISSGSTLALSGTGSIAQSSGVTDNGTLDISGATNGASIANLAGSGNVNLGSQTLTLANASGTFKGSFTGVGKLTLQGSGTLIFNGNGAAFAGTTEVASGLLEVGDIGNPRAVLGGSVTVDAAGTLRGHGTVAGDVINNGIVKPGGSIGTLTIGGNYTQASNAALSVEVSPSAASQLKVNGSATLAGTLAITYDPGTYSARTYTLLSANSRSGRFSGTSSTGASNLGALTPSLAYTANSVDLVLAAASATPFVIAPTDSSIYTALGTSAVFGAQAQGTALLDRMGRAARARPGTPYGWVTATGTRTKIGGTDGEPGFEARRYGFLAGLDSARGIGVTGVAVGYDHADISERDTGDSGTIDALRAAVYGSRNVGPVNLSAAFGAALDFLSQKRPFGAQGTAQGDHLGHEINVGGQASLPMTFGGVTVIPRIGLRYAYFHAGSFDEGNAGGQDLNVGTDNVRSLQPYAGVTVDKAFGDALKPVNVELRIGYAHELLDANRAIGVASQDNTPFTAPGTSLPRGYLTAGVGIAMHPKKNVEVSLDYDTVFNTTHASTQQGNVRVAYQF